MKFELASPEYTKYARVLTCVCKLNYANQINVKHKKIRNTATAKQMYKMYEKMEIAVKN